MFNFLEKFKKRQLTKPDQEIEDLEAAWKVERAKLANIATSDVYLLIKELFEVKIELLRDKLEITKPVNEEETKKVLFAQAEIEVMRGFINDIEDMKTALENEILLEGK